MFTSFSALSSTLRELIEMFNEKEQMKKCEIYYSIFYLQFFVHIFKQLSYIHFYIFYIVVFKENYIYICLLVFSF